MLRRTLLATPALLLSSAAMAQEGVTRMVISFPPGGPVDTVGRALAEQLGKQIGGTVLIINKPGGNGAIAANEVAHAKPDGSTLWLSSAGAIAINPSLYPHLTYDVARDFVPVGQVASNVEILAVAAGHPAKTAAEFVAAARKSAEPLPLACTGVGGVPYLAIAEFADAAGVKFLTVPYKGAAPAVTDLLGGQVQGMFGDIAGFMGLIKGGKVRALGVGATARSAVLPDVPTLEEQGFKNVYTNNWYGVFAPAKTPAAKVAALSQAIGKALAVPALRDRLVALGAEPAPSTPEALNALAKADTAKWAALIKAKHIKLS